MTKSQVLQDYSPNVTEPNPDNGYLREGPVAVAQFEVTGDNDDPDIKEQGALRQRNVHDLMAAFLADLGVGFPTTVP